MYPRARRRVFTLRVRSGSAGKVLARFSFDNEWARRESFREAGASMSATQVPMPLTDIPVIDITPPSGWLDLNFREL